MGHQRVRGNRAANGQDDERAPRQGRRRQPRKRPLVLDFGPPESDDARGVATGGRAGKGGRGGKHQQLVDDAMDDYESDESESDSDDGGESEWQDEADDYFAGEQNDEGGEQEAEQQTLADEQVTIVLPPDTTEPVQVTSPELESLEDEANEADAHSATVKEVEVEQEKVEVLQLVATTLPTTAPQLPLIQQSIEVAKHAKVQLEHEESEREANEGETDNSKAKAAEQESEGQEKETEGARRSPIDVEIGAILDHHQLTWESLNAEEQQALTRHVKALAANWDPSDHSRPNPAGGSTKVKNSKQRFNQADRGVDEVIAAARQRARQATESAKAEADAKQFAVEFERDKAQLSAAVGRADLTGGARTVLDAVLDHLKLSSGGTEAIDKKYPKDDIMEAHRKWKWLIKDGKIGRYYTPTAITSLWNPGWDDADIYWKQRGPVEERNRNFMATVGKHSVNIHVSPPGPNSRKK